MSLDLKDKYQRKYEELVEQLEWNSICQCTEKYPDNKNGGCRNCGRQRDMNEDDIPGSLYDKAVELVHEQLQDNAENIADEERINGTTRSNKTS